MNTVMEAANVHSDAKFSRTSLKVIGICALVFFLDGLIHTILGPLAPQIAPKLQLSNSELGPVFSANLIGQTIGLLGFPLIANQKGHRLVVLICAAGFGIAQWATALAWNGTSLFAFRLFDGVFLGGAMPSCLALVANFAPPNRRGLAVTMLFTGYGTGATVSGVLAAAFAYEGGWRIAIAMVGMVSAMTLAVAWFWLRNVDDLAEPGMAGPPRVRAREVVAPGMLAGTLLLWLLFIVMLTIQYCLSSWLPTLLVQVGRDEHFAALSVTVFSLGGIIAALGVGLLIDRFGATIVLCSFLIIAAAMLLLIGRSIETAPENLLMAMLVTGGFFFLGAYGGVNVVLVTYYPQALRATGIGLAKSIGRVGTIIAPVIIGFSLDWGVHETTIVELFAVPAAVAVASLLGIHFASRKVPADEASQLTAAKR